MCKSNIPLVHLKVQCTTKYSIAGKARRSQRRWRRGAQSGTVSSYCSALKSAQRSPAKHDRERQNVAPHLSLLLGPSFTQKRPPPRKSGVPTLTSSARRSRMRLVTCGTHGLALLCSGRGLRTRLWVSESDRGGRPKITVELAHLLQLLPESSQPRNDPEPLQKPPPAPHAARHSHSSLRAAAYSPTCFCAVTYRVVELAVVQQDGGRDPRAWAEVRE